MVGETLEVDNLYLIQAKIAGTVAKKKLRSPRGICSERSGFIHAHAIHANTLYPCRLNAFTVQLMVLTLTCLHCVVFDRPEDELANCLPALLVALRRNTLAQIRPNIVPEI